MATKIEWTRGDDGTAGETWNVVTGCTRISEGCEHCYIERTPPMRMAHRRFDGPQIGATTGVQLHPERLGRPLRWRSPRRVFVNSMSDLFHEDIPAEYIARVWAMMAATPQHTYQILTKRPARMRALIQDDPQDLLEELLTEDEAGALYDAPWPLPNVWLGVSTESQRWADIRIPQLLDTPAAVRWISAEPLLGPVDLTKWIPGRCTCQPRGSLPPIEGVHWNGCPALGYRDLDWVVVGGETGPGARPMQEEWARSLRGQCAAAGVPFFLKQAGTVLAKQWGAASKKGSDPAEWPEPFPREFPAGVSG
ncbi:DUF5131 family protein [Nocardia wallacei]|uniref:DUF5131 family protein n=1 Tax=Nocardia wallacei TaxID=480035 RepID=UPI002455CF18|nr:phage Gp37/Gp68 family protein [Nocardia wallacei]